MAKTKTLTKAQEKLQMKLKNAVCNAQVGVWAAGPNNQTPWNTCYQMADADTQDRFNEATKALNDFNYDMVQEGRGWYNTFGGFQPY